MASPDLLHDEENNILALRKSRFFYLLLVIFAVYLFFIAYDTVFDMFQQDKPLDSSDWLMISMIFFLPLLGTILFWVKNKAGWIICSLYFFFFASYGLAYFGSGALKNTLVGDISYRNALVVSVSVLCASLLMLKETRLQFNIHKILVFIILALSLTFAAFVFYFNYE